MNPSTTTHRPAYYIYPGLIRTQISVCATYLSPEQRLEFIMQVVQEEFRHKYDFDMEPMMTPTREMPYALARMAYYYFARALCPTLTLNEIGRSIPALSQHHSTIIHAQSAVQNILDTRDVQYYDIIAAIEARLR